MIGEEEGIRTSDVNGVKRCDIMIWINDFFFQAEDGIRGRDVTGVRRVLFRSGFC